jgi:dihydropyrimidinase
MLSFFSKPRRLFSTLSKASNPLFIRGGTIVNSDFKFEGDILTQNGKIASISRPGEKVQLPPNTQTIDAKGKYLIPGGIDPHCHLELPFMGTTAIDDFNVGTQASIAGGTTTFIDFIIPDEKGLIAAYDDWRQRADAKVNCDYALHCAITHWNEKVSKEMEEIVKRGVQSFKVFMAYKGSMFY